MKPKRPSSSNSKIIDNKKNPKDIPTQKSIKMAGTSGKQITKQIDKLMKQIESTNDDIKQTEKFLDVDLFLKEQKKKKLDYAKNLNAVYEAQKKIREQKLYKKHNREAKQKQAPEEIKKSANESNVSNLLFMKSNMAVINPTVIIKSLANQYEQKNAQWVRPGHIFKDQQCGNLDGLRKEQQKIFSKLYRTKKEYNTKKYDGQTQSQHIVWKNIKQVCQNSLQLQTMPTMVGEHQFLVGASQNQQILNALAFMTSDIAELLFAETQNTFSAKLNSASKQLTVVTDKKILVRQFTHKNVNLGARCQNSNIIWPTLVEKCFMKIEVQNGFQAGKSQGTLLESIFTLYGLDAQIVQISNQNIIKQNFPNVLGHLLQEGRVGFMNVGREKKTCYESRIYILESVREEVVHETKKQKKHDILYKIRDPWRGKLLDSQNRSKFNILQILGHFNTMVILRSYPERWVCLRINFSYFSNGAIGLSNNQWTKNPQYLFTITKKNSLRIILRKSGNNIQQKSQESQNIFGYLLFENKEADNKIQCMKMDALIKKTKSNDLCEAVYTCQLNKGNYILIPYSTYKSEKAYQFYTLDFIVQKQNYIQFGKARIHQWEYITQKGARLSSGQKTIQSLESKQKFQRPKIQKFQLPKLFGSKITKKTLQSLNLNLFEKSQIKHFFMPGFIRNLVINTSIELDSKAMGKNIKNDSKKTNTHEELNKEQQSENLSILLGYDAINDEVNHGKMREYIEQSVGCYDFEGYGLGQEGLIPILQSLTQHPQIIELNLIANQLNDSAITYLCYYLQKSSRVELRQLKLQKNNIGFNGKNALKGLKTAYPKLKITTSNFKIQ